MRGGIGDIVLYSSVLKSLIEQFFPDDKIVCGTSRSCEKLVRSIPFFHEIIVDFRPRYVRQDKNGIYSYRDRRTKVHLGPFDYYYCLDHPYRGTSIEDNQNVHIIDMAARILGVNNFERCGKVFISDENKANAENLVKDFPEKFVLIAPISSQNIKIPSYSLFKQIITEIQDMGLECVCLTNKEELRFSEICCKYLFARSIMDLAAVLDRCTYYVGLDSGISHIAAALSKPMTTLQIGYRPERSGVLNPKANVMYFENRSIPRDRWKELVEQIVAHIRSS